VAQTPTPAVAVKIEHKKTKVAKRPTPQRVAANPQGFQPFRSTWWRFQLLSHPADLSSGRKGCELGTIANTQPVFKRLAKRDVVLGHLWRYAAILGEREYPVYFSGTLNRLVSLCAL
jgi:hypothetical protein